MNGNLIFLTLAPQVFGWQHLVYAAIFIVITVAMTVLSKIYFKTEKSQTIYIKAIAGALFVSVLINRFAIAASDGWDHFLPNTLCGVTSVTFSIAVLLGKKDSKIYHALWYLALVGGLATMVYPDFLPQNESFFYINTISGLIHHSIDVLLCVALVEFGWFRPELKNWYVFPLVFSEYIVWGLFDMKVIGVSDAMCINKSILSGTPINCWFILFVGTALVIALCLVCEFFYRRKGHKQVIKMTASSDSDTSPAVANTFAAYKPESADGESDK